jgi:hypothetical protein
MQFLFENLASKCHFEVEMVAVGYVLVTQKELEKIQAK